MRIQVEFFFSRDNAEYNHKASEIATLCHKIISQFAKLKKSATANIYKEYGITPITNGESFSKFLENVCFQESPVVLFVDEMDYLLKESVNSVILDDFLSTLRGLKEERDLLGINLQSVIGVGPFSVLKMTTKSMSPFNASDACNSIPFTKEETDMFQEETPCKSILKL